LGWGGIFSFLGSAHFATGALETLKQGKKDADQIQKGSECGLSFVDFTEFAEGDSIQFYEEVELPKRL
jgi:translation initiation factor IF-2